MEFNQIGGADYYEDATFYWVSISGVPPEIQRAAREIDGKAYLPDCFEMCVIFDLNTRQFSFETSDGELNIFYVDDNGHRCWFQADLTDDFLNEVYSACEQITSGSITLSGYAVKESVRFDDRHGYALSEKPGAKQPFAVTYIEVDKYGRWHYHGERVYASAEAAKSAYSSRIKGYQQYHNIVKPSLSARMDAAKQEAAQLNAAQQAAPSHKPHDRDAR